MGTASTVSDFAGGHDVLGGPYERLRCGPRSKARREPRARVSGAVFAHDGIRLRPRQTRTRAATVATAFGSQGALAGSRWLARASESAVAPRA